MNRIFDKVEDTSNLQLFTLQTIIIILSALPIVVIDIIFQKYRNKFPSKMTMRNVLNIIQFLIGILYIYFIMIFFKKFSTNFQSTLPGMFFPAVFFSLQYTLFTDIHNNIESLMN
jgi:hypothetical protein